MLYSLNFNIWIGTFFHLNRANLLWKRHKRHMINVYGQLLRKCYLHVSCVCMPVDIVLVHGKVWVWTCKNEGGVRRLGIEMYNEEEKGGEGVHIQAQWVWMNTNMCLVSVPPAWTSFRSYADALLIMSVKSKMIIIGTRLTEARLQRTLWDKTTQTTIAHVNMGRCNEYEQLEILEGHKGETEHHACEQYGNTGWNSMLQMMLSIVKEWFEEEVVCATN